MTFDPSPNREDKTSGFEHAALQAGYVPLADETRTELCNLIDLLLEEQLEVRDRDRLAQLISASEEAQSLYISEMNRHAALVWQWGAFGGQEVESRESRVESESISDQWSVASGQILENQKSEIRNHKYHTPHAPRPTPLVSTLHSWAFSYAVATLLLGIALLGAWFSTITHYDADSFANNNSRRVTPSGGSDNESSQFTFVGRVSGMVDCQFADSSTETVAGAGVTLGRRYSLKSGLMEISYDSGAKVILQGPCEYTVESPSSGFLQVGKLVAKVESQESSVESKAESGKWKAEYSRLSTLNSRLFAVRTPTAVVEDLGTEFGVEVSGETVEVHVLQGEVAVQRQSDGASQSLVKVKQGEAVRLSSMLAEFAPARFLSRRFVSDIRKHSGRMAEAAYIKRVLADRPAGYWPLNEPPGAKTFMDASGNGLHCLQRGDVRSGEIGPYYMSAAAFDGRSRIETNTHADLSWTNCFTVEAWVFAAETEGPMRAVSVDNASANSLQHDRIGWGLAYIGKPHNTFDNFYSCFAFTAYEVKDASFNQVYIPFKTWTHLAVVFDHGNSAHLFVNGTRRASVELGAPARVGQSTLSIGGMATNEECWKGRLAHVAVYPRELSERQIRRHLMPVPVVPVNNEGDLQDGSQGPKQNIHESTSDDAGVERDSGNKQ